MQHDHALIERLESLERTLRRQRRIGIALTAALGVLGLAAWARPAAEELRAQRLVVVDDQGVEVGRFGFEATSKSIGWRIEDPRSRASAYCVVGEAPVASNGGASTGLALLQMEAGWAISQHFVRADDPAVGLNFVVGEDEKTAVQLAADSASARLALSPLPHSEDILAESDDSHALELVYDGEGPRVRGIGLDGATTIALP